LFLLSFYLVNQKYHPHTPTINQTLNQMLKSKYLSLMSHYDIFTFILKNILFYFHFILYFGRKKKCQSLSSLNNFSSIIFWYFFSQLQPSWWFWFWPSWIRYVLLSIRITKCYTLWCIGLSMYPDSSYWRCVWCQRHVDVVHDIVTFDHI